MKISAIIEQLKTYATIFNGNVAGVADYEVAKDQVWLPQPAAYVVPLEDEPEPNTNRTGLFQFVKQTIAVIVDLDNSADRRGQATSTDAVDDVRTAIFSAILNWRPLLSDPPSVGDVNTDRGFAYARGGFLYADRARMRWQFDFSIEDQITSDDGFQLPSVPLVEADVTVTDQGSGETLDVFVATLPQS